MLNRGNIQQMAEQLDVDLQFCRDDQVRHSPDQAAIENADKVPKGKMAESNQTLE